MTVAVARSNLVTMTEIDSPVGVLVAGATDRGLCLLEFRDREILETQIAKVRARVGPTESGSQPLLEQTRRELDEYFGGKRRDFTVPLVYPGTPFQLKVWNALRAIPFGATISYEELAHRIGSPAGQRAAGHANGQNPIAIIIPCHRVINKDGKLGGYGGGLWRKRILLDLERDSQRELFIPFDACQPGASTEARVREGQEKDLNTEYTEVTGRTSFSRLTPPCLPELPETTTA